MLTSATDTNGRAYVKLCDCKHGTKLKADGGFECILPDAVLTVIQADDGLYVPCLEGKHYLVGQLDFETSEYLIGFYPVGEAPHQDSTTYGDNL